MNSLSYEASCKSVSDANVMHSAHAHCLFGKTACPGNYRSRLVRLPIKLISIIFVFWLPVSMAVEEPEGYRLDRYDDVVPATLSGAVRVSALEVAKLQSTADALIVDVIPEHRKPDDLPAGQLWFPVAHEGVAGALWLPDVGYGALSEATEAYFKKHLLASTNGNLEHPVVFYCRSDCWMSWNAAKRALSFGYSQVYWFADGINDWQFENLETQRLEPAPGARH
ncbi:MAG: rhodanese-like domain-containing protein [Granulosicoccus sp.]